MKLLTVPTYLDFDFFYGLTEEFEDVGLCAEELADFFDIPKGVKKFDFVVYDKPSPHRVQIKKTRRPHRKGFSRKMFNVDGSRRWIMNEPAGMLFDLLQKRKAVYVELQYGRKK